MLAAIKLVGHDIYVVWDKHGTKLIGAAVTLVGTLALTDHATLVTLLGKHASGWVMVAAGLLAGYRGFRNTQTQIQSAPAPAAPAAS